MIPLDRITSPYASLCAVCRRQASPLGYRPRAGDLIIWVCSEQRCQSIIHRVYAMQDELMTAHEIKAMRQAGKEGGAYLDLIEKSDLAGLSKEEWEEFLGRVILGFTNELRRSLGADEAPF